MSSNTNLLIGFHEFSRHCKYCSAIVYFDSRVKSKQGYLVPLNANCTIHDDRREKHQIRYKQEEYQDIINAVTEEIEVKESLI